MIARYGRQAFPQVVSMLLAIVAGTSNVHAEAAVPSADAGQALCSKEGLIALVPQFKGPGGRFKVPDPRGDGLPAFLAAQQGLSNAIDMILAQANATGNPFEAARKPNKPLILGAHWRAAEIGIQTDGLKLSFVDPKFASYGGPSFLEGLNAIAATENVFYVIRQQGARPALVYPMPTVHPCVNRLVLAAANTVGSWPAPTYAIGPAGGEAFLIVNICQDLGRMVLGRGQRLLSPNAELILAFQWAATPDMAPYTTDQKAHQH